MYIHRYIHTYPARYFSYFPFYFSKWKAYNNLIIINNQRTNKKTWSSDFFVQTKHTRHGCYDKAYLIYKRVLIKTCDAPHCGEWMNWMGQRQYTNCTYISWLLQCCCCWFWCWLCLMFLVFVGWSWYQVCCVFYSLLW